MLRKNKGLHHKNLHKNGYNFKQLLIANPNLKPFVNTINNKLSIDFSNPKAIFELNKALLFSDYTITFWKFPNENLCPPIPGRADYIHYLKDLLDSSNLKKNISVIDIGTGANCIYPLLGHKIYNWSFLGIDIDQNSLVNAEKIVSKNKLSNHIKFKHQKNAENIIDGIFSPTDFFSATICNPPFYSSLDEVKKVNTQKNKNLGIETCSRNFSGKLNELCYKGGEKAFLHNYLYQSSKHPKSCYWYTTLVSKKENVKSMISSLTKLGATSIKTIPMNQGNKITRIVAWTFLTKKEQLDWIKKLS